MSWDRYERSVDRGPWSMFFVWGSTALGMLIVICVVSYFLGWFGSAAALAKREFGPDAALAKYEWFITQSNSIEKMDKDIVLFESRRVDVDKKYASYGEDKSKWPLDVRTTYNRESQQAKDDLVAVTSQRNKLVAEYNAQSEKFNWAPFQTDPRRPTERYFDYVVK